MKSFSLTIVIPDSLMNVPVLDFAGVPREEIAFSVEEIELRQYVVRLSIGEARPPGAIQYALIKHRAGDYSIRWL